jgi:micrococcal nuclease
MKPARSVLLFALAGAGLALACDDATLDTPTPPSRSTPALATPQSTTVGTAQPTEAPAACDAAELADVFCADIAGMETAIVVDIIDGDTLDVLLDGREERVRIFGIDTPERGDRCFREASDLLESLAGEEIRMQTDARTVDSNGRLLRYVYQPGGLSIDAVMIAAGAAHAWTRDGALRNDLVALEAEARDRRSGCLWG